MLLLICFFFFFPPVFVGRVYRLCGRLNLHLRSRAQPGFLLLGGFERIKEGGGIFAGVAFAAAFNIQLSTLKLFYYPIYFSIYGYADSERRDVVSHP